MKKIIDISLWLRKHGLTESFHGFIQRPDSFTRFTSGILGWTWEQDFAKLCEHHGLDWRNADVLDSQHDCVVSGKRVQCKHTSALTKADIRNKNKKTKRRYLVDDFEVLALRALEGVYLIPVNELLCPNTPGHLRHSICLDNYKWCKDYWEIFQHVHSTV